MKRLPISLKLLLFFFALILSAYNAGSLIDSVLNIPYVDSTPDIDGVLDTNWDFSNIALYVYSTNNSPATPAGGAADLSAWYQVAWNENGLYFFGRTIDDTVIVTSDTSDQHVSDSWEIFLDGGNDDNTTYDSNDVNFRWIYNYTYETHFGIPGGQAAWVATADGYDIEILIPANYLTDSFYTTLTEDMEIGWEVQVNDVETDGGPRQNQVKWWYEGNESVSNPSLFGTARLAPASENTILRIPRIVTTPTINGTVDTDEWIDDSDTPIPVVGMYVYSPYLDPAAPDGGGADLSGFYRAAWDENGIYVFGHVIDDTVIVISDTADQHVSDSWEVMIDGGNDDNTTYDSNDAQFRWIYNYPYETRFQAPNGQVAWTATADGYDIELMIPADYLADSLYTNLQDNLEIGWEVQANDVETDGGPRQNLVKWWQEQDETWNNPSLLGTAMLTQLVSISEPVAYNTNLSVPFILNASNNISYVLQDRSTVNLNLYNLIGQVVQELENGVKSAGPHTVSLNASSLPNGVYFCRLEACGQILTAKMLLIK